MQTLLFGSILLTTWIFIWVDLIKCPKPNGTPLPAKRSIKIVGVMLLLSITSFYTALYTATTFIYVTPVYLQLVCISSLCFGTYLVVGARKEMKTLTASEVLFSINMSYSSCGVFKKFTHPMYLGISIILISSWCLLPNILPGLFLVTSLALLCTKTIVETTELRKLKR
jgi:protein-S-isoprenylcysteine O-methyltransferase Ste14